MTNTDPGAVEQLLNRLAPDGTGVAVCRPEPAQFDQLSAEERVLVRSARAVRRADFAAGRWCAHRALAAIGADAGPIGRGPRGQPAWPAGVTGSISHAAGLAAAVAAHPTTTVHGLGVDLEVADALGEDLWPHTLTPSERAACEESDEPVAAATLRFAAKEATFKAVYPLLGEEIDFLEAHTEIDADAGIVEIPRLGVSTAFRHGRAGDLVVCVAIVAVGT